MMIKFLMVGDLPTVEREHVENAEEDENSCEQEFKPRSQHFAESRGLAKVD